MRGRQSVRGPIVAVDLELLNAVHAFEGTETLQRNLKKRTQYVRWIEVMHGEMGNRTLKGESKTNLRRSRDKLQEFRSVRLFQAPQRSPEPLKSDASEVRLTLLIDQITRRAQIEFIKQTWICSELF